ncbi:unnamed protein product [Moneuplotes crassus]|uniref:Nudix hydrolase domain-containing protein n=2 Tax=Euplotes crassus TaxID=5936 RepID=A0AAD1XW69_EUPCR|nr:unnamed protein product [Moneuplotes crassus]
MFARGFLRSQKASSSWTTLTASLRQLSSKPTVHRLRPGQYKLPKLKPKLEFTGKYTYGFKGNWISTVNLEYTKQLENGAQEFEAVSRPFFIDKNSKKYKVKHLDEVYGGVDVIAVSECPKSNQKIVLLEVIYRIPTQRYVISFPAGFQDSLDEPSTETALRELKEETGYVGHNPREAYRHWTDPWKSCDRCALVYVDIDLSSEENLNVDQKPDYFEDITPFWVPVKDLKNTLINISKENNFDIDGRVHTWAEGIEFASKL